MNVFLPLNGLQARSLREPDTTMQAGRLDRLRKQVPWFERLEWPDRDKSMLDCHDTHSIRRKPATEALGHAQRRQRMIE